LIVTLLIFANIGSIEQLPDDPYVGKSVNIDKSLGYLLPLKEWYWGKEEDYSFFDYTASFKEDLVEGFGGKYEIVGFYRIHRGGLACACSTIL